METIVVYLDNMFANLPKTPELKRMKLELLSGMEEKYLELKREGKSENEAIGIVISEFGNIEELTAELGILSSGVEETVPMLTEEDVYDYMATKRSSGLMTGLGIVLCIWGLALLIVLDTVSENMVNVAGDGSMELGTMLGLVGMFVMIAVAVGIFIHSGMKLDRFKYQEQSFQLPYGLKMTLQHSQAQFAPTYRLSLITGVCLCVLSPTFIFAAEYINDDFASYGFAACLLIVAVAVFMFVYFGNIQGAYMKLLEESHITSAKKEEERILDTVVWSLAAAVFLFLGLVYQRWDVNWVVFPIVAILSVAFKSIYSILKRKNVS